MSKDIKETILDLYGLITHLEKIVVMPALPHDIVLFASIKVFEMSFELFWKTLKKKLEEDFSVQAFGPKMVLQQAYAAHLISDEKMWIAILNDCNLTMEVYKKHIADDMYGRIKQYAPFLRLEFDNCFKN